MKAFPYRIIFNKLLGWKIIGLPRADITKSVWIVIPHTSWHDFYIGALARGVMGIEINYVAKKELFRFPFGWFFKWMGGRPLDRTGKLNKVDAIAELFDQHKVFRLGIAPEGTRMKVTQLKSGFYYIAMKAGVPIIPVAFDYKTKEVRIGEPFYTTGNYEMDLKYLGKHFQDVNGKVGENGFVF